MTLGTLLSASGLLLSGVAYNRDGYSDNVQMRQNQMYQEKNYYITWIAAVREEVRDIMTIFVGRMGNYNVVGTLIASMAALGIVEGEVAESCPDFVAHSFYISQFTAAMYLFMSVMYATRGITVAYKSGMAFLVAVVPDPLDNYNFDYMQQVTRSFEKDIWNVFRPPLFDLLSGSAKKAAERVKARKAGLEQTGEATATEEPSLESLPRGDTRPAAYRAARAVSAAGLKRPRSSSSLDTLDEQCSTSTTNTFPSGPSPGLGPSQCSAASYFESLGMYSELWEPFAVAAEDSLIHGILCLGHGAIYFCLGRLYDRSLRWAPLTILSLFILLAVILFCDSGNRFLSRYDDDPESGGHWTRKCNQFVKPELLVMFLMTAGPMTCAMADKLASPWTYAVFVPVSYMCHAVLALVISLCAFQSSLEGNVQSDKTKDESSSSVGMDIEVGSSQSSTAGVFSQPCSSPAKYMSEQSQDSGPKEKENVSDDTAGKRLRVQKFASTGSTASTSSSYASFSSATSAGDTTSTMRQDPESLLNDLLHSSRTAIRTSRKMIRMSNGFVHSIAAFAWLSIFCWSLVVYVARSPVMWPEVAVEEIPIELPNPYFKPTIMACSGGHVFMADRFELYELTGKALRPVPCSLSETVQDFALSCNSSSCWPLVLTEGSPHSVHDCSSGLTKELLQAPGAAQRLVSLGRGAVAALHGKELVQYRWSDEGKGFHPQWSMAANVKLPGLHQIDVAEDAKGHHHLVQFRSADVEDSAHHGNTHHHLAQDYVEVEPIHSTSAELGEQQQLHSVTRLPSHLPALQSGCVADGGSSILVLLQGDNAAPRLVKIRTNTSATWGW